MVHREDEWLVGLGTRGLGALRLASGTLDPGAAESGATEPPPEAASDGSDCPGRLSGEVPESPCAVQAESASTTVNARIGHRMAFDIPRR